MDELQITFVKGNFFIWGVSSNPEEGFTPTSRLEEIYKELFSIEASNKKIIKDLEKPINFPKSSKKDSKKGFFDTFNSRVEIFERRGKLWLQQTN